jgi:hypothetical protein
MDKISVSDLDPDQVAVNMLLTHAFVSSLVSYVLESLLRMQSKFSVLRIRIRDPVLFWPLGPDPGSRMGKIGIRIRDKNLVPYF